HHSGPGKEVRLAEQAAGRQAVPDRRPLHDRGRLSVRGRQLEQLRRHRSRPLAGAQGVPCARCSTAESAGSARRGGPVEKGGLIPPRLIAVSVKTASRAAAPWQQRDRLSPPEPPLKVASAA